MHHYIVTSIAAVSAFLVTTPALSTSLVSRASGKCVTVSEEPKEGVFLVQSECSGHPLQSFELWENDVPGPQKGAFSWRIRSLGGELFAISATSYGQPVILVKANPNTWNQAFYWDSPTRHLPDEAGWQHWGAFNPSLYGCLEVRNGSHDDRVPIMFQECMKSNSSYSDAQEFAFAQTSTIPHENIVCFVFDDGYINRRAATAIFISGVPQDLGKSCTSDGTARGVCRKWFGQCRTMQTLQPVKFKAFDDGGAKSTSASDAIFVPPSANRVCVPDGTWRGTCRKWFGLGETLDGRKVTCRLFEDGSTDLVNTTAIYFPGPIPTYGAACAPDGTERGICRRWFGECVTE
jgi:hypothetical protein